MKPRVPLLIAAMIAATATWYWWPEAGDGKTAADPVVRKRERPDRYSDVASSRVLLNERLNAARAISTDLTDAELKGLLEFLSGPLDEQSRKDDLVAINEVMNQLRQSGMACGEYATALCSLILTPGTHPVVRDYAIQHSIAWIQDAAGGASPVALDEADHRRLLDSIIAFIQEPKSVHETGFGTTLNALRALQSTNPAEAGELFALSSDRITAIATGAEASPLGNRIASIQTLSALPDRPAARELIRTMAVDTPPGSPVKLAAIAALGDLGDGDDLPVLRSIGESDPRLVYAARSAVTRLESALSTSR